MVMVARMDLGMGKGKIAAQCAHAAVDLYESLLDTQNEGAKKWVRDPCQIPGIIMWSKTGPWIGRNAMEP